MTPHSKYIFSLLLLLGLLSCLHASAEKPPRAHQFYLGYGLFDFSYLGQFNFNPMMSDYVQTRVIGQPGIGMFEYRQVRKGFGFGICVSVRDVSVVRRYNDGRVFSNSYRFIMTMPHLEYFWVAQGNYVVSSQLGIGFRSVYDTYRFHNSLISISNHNRFAFQFSPLIVSYGNRNWQGRFDVGFGHRGFGALGLVYQL
ncbi:MAG: hypothetical protein ACK417_00190 [Bacteroidia bacterium]